MRIENFEVVLRRTPPGEVVLEILDIDEKYSLEIGLHQALVLASEITDRVRLVIARDSGQVFNKNGG